jgi:hypothetical protein
VSTDIAGAPSDTDTIAAPPEEPPAPPPTGRPPAPAPTAQRRRRFHWPRFGIVSKLLLMLLATSIISCLVIGVVAYRSGRDALRDKAFEQLRFVRNARAEEITHEYTRLLDNLAVFTRGFTSIQALQAFTKAFDDLGSATIDEAHAKALTDYYTNTFVPKLARNFGTETLPDVFIPKSPAQRYLQAW